MKVVDKCVFKVYNYININENMYYYLCKRQLVKIGVFD